MNGYIPFIHYDCMPRSGLSLRRCRDKAGLDEQLLIRPGSRRHLEIDNLASFIDIRLCYSGPRCCRTKHLVSRNIHFSPTAFDLQCYSRFMAFMWKPLPFSGRAAREFDLEGMHLTLAWLREHLQVYFNRRTSLPCRRCAR